MDLLVGVRLSGTRAHRPALAEVFVAVEVAAIIVAAVLLTVWGGGVGGRASCRNEVSDVRSAIAAYRLEFGNVNPTTMGSLVSLKLLKAAPGPVSPSVRAGFVYDARSGTYAGGTCTDA